MLTSRKKRPLERKSANRDARLIVVATEGSKTEEIYFKIFHDTRVQVKIISSQGGRSSPIHILQNMEDYINTYDLAEDDELWLVVDRDQWAHSSLQSVARSCLQQGINLAVSNPCFELWLAHHLDCALPQALDARTLVAHLKLNIGSYSKSKYDPTFFCNKITTAIVNAENFDAHKNRRWPDPVGTRVYKLARSILSLS